MADNRRRRVREFGIEPGSLQPGEHNALTDVPAVVVGHERLSTAVDGMPVRTGVTVVDVTGRDLYRRPLTGAVDVLNGYGKSVGLVQVAELGEIETPVGLTNTLDVWTVADGLVDRTLDRHGDAISVNPIVGECNDGRLSDIRGRHVTADHVAAALSAAESPNTAEGCVGAGTGTTGFGWKAGIGTASRVVDGATVGALVQMNTGQPGDLRVDGLPVESYVDADGSPAPSAGSVLMLVGTDADLTARQLRRCTSRAALGLARTGAIAHHGSGDVALGFATASGPSYDDADLTPLFRAVVESTEEAVYNSITRAETTAGIDETSVPALPATAITRAVDAAETRMS